MTPTSFRAAVPTAVVWDPALLEYRFHATHPMDPVRLDLTQRLCREFGILDDPLVRMISPGIAEDETLLSVHDAGYVDAVKTAASGGQASAVHGLGTEDTPVFPEMHLGAARIAQGSLECAEAILAGEAVHAVNFAGGLHHAARARAGGFCVYNDAAVATQRLLDGGLSKVVYLDVDAHHGDGTQDIFYDDPRVMTISLHQTGVSLYPGTGFPAEIGGRAPDGTSAEGTVVNVALPPQTGDAGWLRAFHAVVPALVRAFEPDAMVSQHGCDTHEEDPLTDLRLSIDGQRQLALDIAQLAEEACGDRWIATGGGGYSVHRVVPRSWTHLTAIAAGDPIPLRTLVPEPWREHVRRTCGVEAPERMNDDAELWWRSWELGYDPSDAVDRAVMQTRRELFPLYGLDPWFD
ncbi:acetoin utilization protein AcuC [Nesterenkonia xinjiangensis]|uniref:Acetoin utilization protein AcuC n=1 Tax=Nesterenkonia xinjiangensis TaxID=225327 RepID=A0A7Z0GKJ7_9MICC|nr:acetoin utilization protein AcuC [Nesterenkonia xinjiangensis]